MKSLWLRIYTAMQGTQVQSLVRELRSHVPQSNWASSPQTESPCATMKDSTLCNEDPRTQRSQINKYFFKRNRQDQSKKKSGENEVEGRRESGIF